MSKSKITPLPGENDLTPAQARLIACLLTGCTVRAAAREAGIIEKTAFNYLNMPHVKKALATATQEIMGSAIERLQLLAMEGLEVIVEIMKDREQPAQVRLKAAQILASRITETKPTELAGSQGVDWSIFTQEQLDIITPIYAQAEREAEQKRREALAPAQEKQETTFV
jgi:phage terminase small subunit